MPTVSIPSRRVLFLVPLLLVALVAWWATKSDSEAAASTAPAAAASTAHAGKIAFDSLPGAVKASVPIRSFTAGGTSPAAPAGSGGGSGKFTADDPTAVLDASDLDPLLLQAVTTGVHLQTVTATLYRPGTTKPQQVWKFANVTVGEVRTTQSGSKALPRVTLALHYAQVTLTAYTAKGAVARSYCFDLASNTAC